MKPIEKTLGKMGWFEIPVSNLNQGISFYTTLFGWTFETFSKETPHYRMIINKETPIGGVYECAELEVPLLMPIIYFIVADVEKILKKAEELGGKIATEKTKIAHNLGFYGHIQDPDGNIIGIISHRL